MLCLVSEKPNNKWFYLGCFGIGLVLVLIFIGILYFICYTKKNIRSTRSTNSAESDSSEN